MKEKKPVIINSNEIKRDVKYEPPLKIAYGIDKYTTGTETMTYGRTFIPPRARNQRHYHTCDAGMFIRKGKLKMFLGPDDDIKEYVVTENYFFYCPAGVIHGLENLTDEPAELLFTYGNCPSKDDAGTVFVEERWDK